MSQKLFLKKLMFSPLAAAILSGPAFAATPIIDEDFTGLSGSLPNDGGNPVDNQDAWFRIGGATSTDFDGSVDGSAIHMGFRYHNTNANFVSSSTWDITATYTFSFDYITSNTQLNGTLPSWQIGAGDGTDRFLSDLVDSGSFISTAGTHDVNITITSTDLINAGVTMGDNIYIRFEKPGDGGALRSAVYQVDNVNLSVVPEPSSAALLGLGGLALILRRRK